MKKPIILLILFAIILSITAYYITNTIKNNNYKSQLSSIPAQTKPQSNTRINPNDKNFVSSSGRGMPPAPPQGISKLGDIVFDSQQGFTLPIVDASWGYDGMFYGAEPQTSLTPKKPKKDAVILASHTTFNTYFGGIQMIGFGLLHSTQVGYQFTLKVNGSKDRHYTVVSVQEVSPYAIPLDTTNDKPTLELYTCVKVAYSPEESMQYPRLLVIATENEN